MAVEFSGTIRAELALKLLNVLDLSTAEDFLVLQLVLQFTNGTGADQANAIWHDRRTIGAGLNETLDLNDPANTLTDAFGRELEFTKVRLMILRLVSETGALKIEPTATGWVSAFLNDINMGAGGWMVLYAPTVTAYSVAEPANDKIRITETSGAASVTYDIVFVGNQ